MANALQLQIADAIAAEVNAQALAVPWTPPNGDSFSAVRRYYARFQDNDLGTLQISVIPLTKLDGKGARGVNQRTFTCWVDFQRMLQSFSSVAEMDSYVNLVDLVLEYFSDQHILTATGLTNYWYDEPKLFGAGEFWSPERLYREHVFEAAIELTVRGYA